MSERALARGRTGSAHESPAVLFARARALGATASLDRACRQLAVTAAVGAELPGQQLLLMNVEADTLTLEGETAVARDLAAQLAGAHGPRPVLEVTERNLTRDPAGLVAAVDRARAAGWLVALDDLGADPASLALMPLLRPDVLKLDLSLIQGRTTVDVAQVVAAVAAQAELTGALVVAEGVETEQHRDLAISLGAHLAQGWLFGRPGGLPVGPHPQPPATAVVTGTGHHPDDRGTPFDLVAGSGARRRTHKSLLMALVRHLERQALQLGGAAVVLGSFQEARHLTPTTSRRWAELAARCAWVGAVARGLDDEPAPGVTGAALEDDDRLCGEWDVVVIGPHYAGALLSLDLQRPGQDLQREFEYVLTHDRPTVLAAATRLLARMAGSAQPVRSGWPGAPGALSCGPGPLHLLRPGGS